MAWNQARTSYVSDYKRAFGAIESDKATEIMKEYLLDWDFGVAAAEVLAGNARQARLRGEGILEPFPGMVSRCETTRNAERLSK